MRRVLLAGGLILSAVLTVSSLVASSRAAAPTLVGKEAPDFVLKAMDGRNLRMSEFRGQVVLGNFGARRGGPGRGGGLGGRGSGPRARVRGRHEGFISPHVRPRLRYRSRLPSSEN